MLASIIKDCTGDNTGLKQVAGLWYIQLIVINKELAPVEIVEGYYGYGP